MNSLKLFNLKNIAKVAKFSTQKSFPLEGIKILDVTRIIAGPYASMILSDLGAEVIKIEKPFDGDESRKWGPPFLKDSTDSVYFQACNRNKKSVCIDLKKGKHIILDLVKQCDVFMENYVPGKMDKLGLGYDDIHKVAPQVVYCSITGFGNKGPYKHRAGYDVIAASMGGLLHITGQEDKPAKVGIAMTDIATGLYAHGAILSALLQRTKTGLGQKIDVDLFSTQISCLINIGANYLNANIDAQRMGTEHISIVPYAAFKTKDGFYTIGAGSNDQFEQLCNCMNLKNLVDDLRFANNSDRVKNRKALSDILNEIFEKHDNDYWSKTFKESSFPHGPVNNMKNLFNDEHVKDIGIVKKLHGKDANEVFVVGPPVQYSNSLNLAHSAPPTLGQHTNEILKSFLNYSDDEIENLKRLKIIQ